MDLTHALLAHPRLYAAFHGAVSRGKLERIAEALRREGLDEAQRLTVLDLGCGPGTSARLFTVKDGWSYTGIDLDPAYIAHARANLSGRFEVGDVTTLDLGGTFDLVLLNSVTHHLDDAGAQGAIDCAARHLARGGTFLLMDMVTPEGPSRAAALRRLLVGLDRGRHCRTDAELKALLRARFKRVEARPFTLSLARIDLWEMRTYTCR